MQMIAPKQNRSCLQKILYRLRGSRFLALLLGLGVTIHHRPHFQYSLLILAILATDLGRISSRFVDLYRYFVPLLHPRQMVFVFLLFLLCGILPLDMHSALLAAQVIRSALAITRRDGCICLGEQPFSLFVRISQRRKFTSLELCSSRRDCKQKVVESWMRLYWNWKPRNRRPPSSLG